MEIGPLFYIVCGLWGLGMIAILISAIRLCYAVEQRSGWKKPGSLPTYAAWVPVILNIGVARDGETQALRRRMNLRFLLILAGFVLFYLWLRRHGMPGG